MRENLLNPVPSNALGETVCPDFSGFANCFRSECEYSRGWGKLGSSVSLGPIGLSRVGLEVIRGPNPPTYDTL